MYAPASSFHVGSEDLNSSFQTCMTDTLPTEPSPQLRDLFLFSSPACPSGQLGSEGKGESGFLNFGTCNSIQHTHRLGD